MIWFHLAVVLLFIFLGARMGGIGVGLAGGAGVLVLALTGLHTKAAEDVPWGVVGIIMPVICAVAAMQLAGGIDYLVHLTERLLRKHPTRITYLAPFVTYMMSLLCGTGHTAYSILPVVVDVAKEHDIRPSRPLSIAVVASHVAVAASPISAAMVALATAVAPLHVGYLQCLAIVIPTTFIGCVVGAVVASHLGVELRDDPIYQKRLAEGLVSRNTAHTDDSWRPAPAAKKSLVIFLIALVSVVVYASLVSKEIAIIKNPPMDSTSAIMVIMFSAAALICVAARKPTAAIASQDTFRAGMVAAICIIGLAWLGNMFVNNYMDAIRHALSGPLQAQPWLAAVFFYFAAPLMFSHAATTTAFMPLFVKIGLPAVALLAAYPAVANYYLLPNYPTTVAAMEMDDTGSTRVGKFVLDHPFVIPGTVSIIVTVVLGFLWGAVIL